MAFRNATSEAAAKFLRDEVISRCGVLDVLVSDGRWENNGLLAALAKTYKIKRVVASTTPKRIE
jgi:hypothetical protein